MKKEIIKPFDLAKAKAGAKLRTKGGYPVEIFKWVARGNYPIRGIIIEEKDDMSACWKLDGSWIYDLTSNDLVIVEEVEEPKFKVGDWLAENEPNNYARFVHILEVVNVQGKERYRIFRDLHNGEDVVECRFIEKHYHFFNIQDAKAGDVLVNEDGLAFIYNYYLEEQQYPFAYGGINVYGRFNLCDGLLPFTHQKVHPATKEQRELLFSKLKEAGYEWDAEKLELKKIKPKLWSDDKSNTFGGFFINFCSDIEEITIVTNTETNYNVFATKKQAKSSLAMARISQIMANDIKNFGGVITDEEWENDEWKFVIYRCDNRIKMISVVSVYHFLAFHTEKQRDLFLEKYPQLVKDFLMIPDK